ncbi:MAG: M1 family metallopeptidase [Acidobacteria bacterium]|nr:M1 family metallopeptidase [Acidobacteriota bacterium]
MNRVRPVALLAAALLWSGATFAAGQPPAKGAASSRKAATGAGALPTLRLPSGAWPLRYSVILAIDPSKDSFDGDIEIDLRFDRPMPVLWLNARELEIDSAEFTQNGRGSKAVVVAGGEDFAGFALDPPAAPGAARLRVSYRGAIQPTGTTGIFRQNVGEDWYAFTQFEATDARRAFPCFDEPSYKVPWQLTLRIPRGRLAVSNTPISKEADASGGVREVAFAATKPLPAYLIAFGVGPFDVVDAGRAGRRSVPLRLFVPRGRGEEARWAKETSGQILDRLESYFGIPYPYEKLDALVIPQTVRFGAMENAGLITWNENLFLAKPSEESASFRRLHASISLHESAHQWFGDLVTPGWWDDTWLNESFATWMAARLLKDWKPEWESEVADVATRSETLDKDTLKSARRIRQPILSPADIDNAFDDISYGKGGAVIAMFESWLGPEKFREGIRRYLADHAYGNATSADFLSALERAGGPGIARAFSTFLDQPGFPLVTADLRCGPGAPPRVGLRQQRLLPEGAAASRALWHVPVCARYGGAASGEGSACVLLTASSAELPLPAAKGCPDWVLANAREVGYYRVLYAGDLLDRLLRKDASRLTLAERVGVLGDVAAFAETGRISMARALALVSGFAADPNREVVSTVMKIARNVDDHLVADSVRPRYERFLRASFGDRARSLGWQPSPGETEDAQMLRPRLLALVAGTGRDPELGREAAELARRWLADRNAVDPALVTTVLSVAARDGDDGFFDRLVAEVRRSTEHRDRDRIFTALGEFRRPNLNRKALDLLLDPGLDSRESIALLWRALGHRETREPSWQFFKTHFDTIAARLPREYLPVLPRAGADFCDAAHREEVRRFFSGRAGKIEGAARPLAQTLESVDRCVALSGGQRAAVASFLQGY